MKISAFFRPKAVSALTEAILRASKSKSFLSAKFSTGNKRAQDHHPIGTCH